MKLHLPNKLRAAVLACFAFVATTVGSASADFVWIGGDNVTADNWNVESNWELTDSTTYPTGGSGPSTSNSNAWDKLVFNGTSGTTAALEGWALKMKLTELSNIATSAVKLQGGCSFDIEKGSTLTLSLHGPSGSGNDGGAVTVDLGGTFNMVLYGDKGGDGMTVNYGDIAADTVGIFNISGNAEGTARTFNNLIVHASLTSNIVSDNTMLHEYTFATYTNDITLANFSSQIESENFFDAGTGAVLTASEENIGKYSVVHDTEARTIKLYYVTGQIAAMTWNGGAEGTWSIGSDTWLTSAGAQTTYVGLCDVIFATEGATVTVSGDIAARNVTIQENTAFTLAESATLQMSALRIDEGATLTMSTLPSLAIDEATGSGNLVLSLNNNAAAGGNSTVRLPGSEFGSVRIASGVFAANLNNQALYSDLGASDLIMANNTTYVIRNGVGESAVVTSGDMTLEGYLTLQVYGSVGNTVLSNNILKAEGADTSIRKTDGGRVTLTGQVEAGHLFVSGGTLSLGDGADVTVAQVRLSENGSNGNKLMIEEGATLHVTGTANNHNNQDSLMLAHWNQTGFLEVNGGVLDAPGAMAFMGWTGTGTFSVNSGTAKLLGVSFWGQNNVFKGTFNLGTDTTGDGVIELGSGGFHDLGSGAVLNLGNGTVRLTADSHIAYNKQACDQGTLNLIGTAAGTTFDTNGHDMVISARNNGGTQLSVADGALNVTGGGNLVKTGEGTLTFNGNVEAGSITIEQGTLQLNGVTSITQAIVNDGTLSLGETGKLSLTSLDSSDSSAVITYTDVVSGSKVNGYAGGIFTIVRASDGTQETVVEGLETAIVVGVEREIVKQDGSYVAVIDGDSGIYFVNEGHLVYGADDNCMTQETTTGIELNGGSLTLGQNLSEGVAVHAAQSAILSVNEGVTVNASSLSADADLLLTGAGVVTVDSPYSLPTNVTLRSDWSGMVQISGVVFSGPNNNSILTDLVTANSKLGLSGCTGWLEPGGTVAANLCLLEGDALKLTDGSSGRIQTFSGNISGAGDFVVQMDGKGVDNVTYVFSGDVSEWTGAFDLRKREGTARAFTLKFTGTGDIATDIKNGETLNAFIGGAGDRTITGNIENSESGTLNLTVQGGGVKAFGGDVAVTSLSVDAGTYVSFSGTTTIGSLTSLGTTITNTGALTISTALPETIANNGANLEIAVGETTLTLTTGAESTDGNGYMGDGYGYVVKGTEESTLTLGESLATGNYKLGADGKSLLYRLSSGNQDVYYINTSTDYTGQDVALVTSGTIQVMDGADLRLTEGSVPTGVAVKTVGSGSVTLDRNATVTVADTPLSVEGASIGRLILAEGTRLEWTASGQRGALGRAGLIVVQDGATFAHRVTNNNVPGTVKFEICGSGSAEGSGALAFGEGAANSGYQIDGSVTLTGDATIWVNGAKTGKLNGEVVGNGYTLTKTGAGTLDFGAPTTGTNKTLDFALDLQGGMVTLNLSNVNMNAAGAESRKIAGKVTMAEGTWMNIYDGYTEFVGGLKVNGEVTLNGQWAKGVNISGLVEGDENAVINVKRDGSAQGDVFNTLVLAADNSESFAGTYKVSGDWTLRADNENALGNATLNLNHATAALTYGVGVHSINLAGLSGEEAGASVTGEGSLVFSGSGEYVFAGAANVTSIVKNGSGTQTLGSIGDGANITVNDGALTVTEVVTAGDVTLSKGTTLNASLTLGGTLSGEGTIIGSLTSTEGSVIALDLTGIEVNGDALIAATSADVSAGKFNLNLGDLSHIETGLYSLLQWEGISAEQFVCDGLADSMELVVSNNVLRLQIGNPDLYWKGGLNGTWDGTETDWSTNSTASVADAAFAENAGTNFLGASGETYTISVQGERTTSAMSVEGGDWSFSATGNADRLTVGKGGIGITGASVTLNGKVSLDNGGGVKMKGDSSLRLAQGTSLSVGGVTLNGTMISANTASLVNFATDNSAFSLSGGTLTNAEAGDKTINLGLSNVALEQNGSGTLTLGGSSNTLSSLKAATGSVVVAGSATVNDTTLSSGATVTSATDGFSIGSATSSVTSGSVSTSSAVIAAALSNVALTTTGDATVNGSQTLASLTNGGASTIAGDVTVTGVGGIALKSGEALTVNGTLTNDSLVIAGSTITAATDRALSLWNGGSTEGLTIVGGSITDSNDRNGEGRTVNVTLSQVDYSFVGSGPLTLNGTQNVGTLSAEDALVINGETSIATLEKSGTVTVNDGATLNLSSSAQELTLAGGGTLHYTGDSLSLAGESSIGTLNVTDISLSEGARLTVGNAGNLTSITLNGQLSGLSSDHLVFDIANGASSLTLNGLSLEMLKNATTYDKNDVLHLGHVGGLADGGLSVADALSGAEDASIYFEDEKLKQRYIISSVDGSITVARVSSANAWHAEDGLWENGGSDEFGVMPDEEHEAGFTGYGSATVTIVGDKKVSGVVINTDKDDPTKVGEYTFRSDDAGTTVDAGEVQVQQGGLVVGENVILDADTLTVNDAATLTVAAEGKVIVNGEATGSITNEGSLSIGDQSEIGLSGTGSLTTSGTTTVTLEEGASISTLTNSGELTLDAASDIKVDTLKVESGASVSLKADTTLATLDNDGSVSLAEGTGLTLTEATTNGGNVSVESLTLAAGTDNTFGKLTVDDEVINSGTLTLGDGSTIASLSGGGSVTAQGDVTVRYALAGINKLTVESGATVTLEANTTVATLDNNGTIDLGIAELTLTEATTNGGDVTAGGLLLADGTDNTFNTLTVDEVLGNGATLTMEGDSKVGTLTGVRANVTGEMILGTVVFDSNTVGSEPLISANSIAAAEGKITFEQRTDAFGQVDPSSLLDVGMYTLISAQEGVSENKFELSAATISAYQAEGKAVGLVPSGTEEMSLFAARAAAGETLSLKVVEDTERTWNTSELTVKDSLGNDVMDKEGNARELSLSGTDAYSSLNNIHRVNVNGDRTIDLTEADPETNEGLVIENLYGDAAHTLSVVGNGKDAVTLKTSEGFAPASAANLSLSELSAKVEGDTALHELTLNGASLDASGSTLTVGKLAGDKGSSLAGDLVVTDAWNYSGSYSGATQLTLQGKGASTIYTDSKLALDGSGQTVTLKAAGNANRMASVNLTDGSKLTLDETLQLTKASAVTNGTLTFNTTITDANAPVVVTEGAMLDVSGTRIVINADAQQGLSLNVDGGTTGRLVASLADGVAQDDNTSLTLTGDFFGRYYRNAQLLDSGDIVADVVTDYYGEQVSGLSNNGSVGIVLLDGAALVNTPQYAGDTAPDQKMLLDALDAALDSGDMQQVDELASAAAGSGTAVMGIAFAGDMERQLRAIRNRTTTMGVDSGYVHEGLPTFNAWINAEGDYRTMDADGTLAGYTLNSWGGTVGVDADLTPRFTAGLAVTAMYGDLKADSAEAKAEGDMDTYYVSLFARYARNAWVHTFVASVGRADLSMERTVTCGDAGSYTTKGDTTGISFGMLYEVGYVVALDEEGSACIQPVANITYKHTTVDGYDESGSDASLSVGSQSLNSLTVGLGARFQAAIGETIYNRTSILELRALAKAETGDRGSSTSIGMLSVPGMSGTVKSAEADAVGVELGAGITVPLGQDAGSLFMDVSAELRGSYTNVNGTVGYRINF